MTQNGSWAVGVLYRFQNQSISLQDANINGAEILGLSTFNPFSDENAFQVKSKPK